MSAAAASALGRRDRLWPAVVASAAIHLTFGGWLLAHRGAPDLEPGQKPIVAKLVRLGEKRPESYLPRKEAAPPPAAPAPAPVAVPVPGAKAAPVLPGAKPKEPPPPKPAAEGKARGESLASVLSRLEREKAAEEPRWGDPTGDAEGDSEEAGEGDRYLALVHRALQSNYRVPATISDRDRLHLAATVVLHIEPNGSIRDFKFERRSGNDAFDEALERAIRATRLPPPPPTMKDAYRRVGLGVNFHI